MIPQKISPSIKNAKENGMCGRTTITVFWVCRIRDSIDSPRKIKRGLRYLEKGETIHGTKKLLRVFGKNRRRRIIGRINARENRETTNEDMLKIQIDRGNPRDDDE